MFALGDDLIIEFPGESWLLSLHLLVMFLFFLLLFTHLTIHGFDADAAAADDHRKVSTVAADHFMSRDHRKAKQIKNNSIKIGINCSQDKYKEYQEKSHWTKVAM
ncbi:uncharacterized protein LOC122093510 [Macadamia integrifolia]|uniref:uncharacterized protein LOC122093510 n=1 Tax=Macadamia integrifolia TaxID=60698 RepID=UPI001C527AC8|nr:uncharacterized protein LOC122093510 [Macadamia integrifolia]